MIGCIIAVIIISAALVGIIAYNGTIGEVYIGNDDWNRTTKFTFRNTDPSPPDTVALNINLKLGLVNISFTDDPALIAQVVMEVPVEAVAEYGAPMVAFSDTAVTLTYQVAHVRVLLGSTSAYKFNVNVTTGAINATMNSYSHIGDMNLSTTSGALYLSIENNANFVGNTSLKMTAVSGAVYLNITKPPSVGMIFTGVVTTGNMNVSTATWTKVSQNVYHSNDYSSSSQSVTITATVATGSIKAVLQ